MKSHADETYRAVFLITLVAAGVVFFWGLGSIPLLTYNEARRAIPAGNMLASGDWLLPRINGELYLAKPPLLYWLAASVSQLLGSTNEWAVRLPSALAAAAVSMAAYRYARLRFGLWPALFAVQLLVANTGFAMFARRAEIEMLLTALCSGAVLSALLFIHGDGRRRWLLLSYFLLGAAMLAKGPLALLFVTLPLLAYALYAREPRSWQALRDPLGWSIALAVGACWYVAVAWQMGFGVWQGIIRTDIVNKVAESSGDPIVMYLLWLVADFFPASLVMFVAPIAAVRRWKAAPETVALIFAALVPLIVYSAFGNKHAKYLLPAYPLFAILLGKRLGEIFETTGPVLRRTILVASLLLPIGYAAFYSVAESRVFDYRVSALPKITDLLARVDEVPVYGYLDLDERLVYYAKRDIPILNESSLQALRAADSPLLLLVENSKIAAVKPLADCLVAEFTPYLKRGKTLAVFGFGSACRGAESGG
jgi:4-amino-4-deoxy-L-arabinose transferase-like glycosyltransferase